MGIADSKVAYSIEEPIEPERFKNTAIVGSPTTSLNQLRSTETHLGFTSFYEKQGAGKGAYIPRIPEKKEWIPTEWFPTDLNPERPLYDPEPTLSDDEKDQEDGGSLMDGSLMESSLMEGSLAGTRSLASSLQVQAERGGKGYGMTKFQAEVESTGPLHEQLSAQLKRACESGEESLAFLALSRAAHILKQQNPDHITIPGRNHEQYDTVNRKVVRTLPTCMGDFNSCSYVSIMMSDHVSRPEVMAVAMDALKSLGLSDLNLPRLEKVGIYNMICLSLMKYMKDFKMTMAACQTITSLGRNANIREGFGKANACDLICQVLLLHRKSANVLADAYRAIIVLTMNDHNRALFARFELCEILSDHMSIYYSDMVLADLIIICFRCMMYRNKANRNRLERLGVIEQLEKCIDYWGMEKDGAKIRYEARDCIGRFANTCC